MKGQDRKHNLSEQSQSRPLFRRQLIRQRAYYGFGTFAFLAGCMLWFVESIRDDGPVLVTPPVSVVQQDAIELPVQPEQLPAAAPIKRVTAGQALPKPIQMRAVTTDETIQGRHPVVRQRKYKVPHREVSQKENVESSERVLAQSKFFKKAKKKLTQEFLKASRLKLAGRMSYWSHFFSSDPKNKLLLKSVLVGKKIEDIAPIIPEKFNCTTFVETVAALSRSETLDEVYGQLTAIRYRQGRANYVNRNHFPEIDWIPNNHAALILNDITKELAVENGLKVKYQTKKIDREGWIRAQLESNEPLRQIASIQKRAVVPTQKTSLPYIPIHDVPKILSTVPEGSIVNLVHQTSEAHPVLITHQGILVPGETQVKIRHATRTGRIRESEIYRYLKLLAMDSANRAWPLVGINIVQFQSPLPLAVVLSESQDAEGGVLSEAGQSQSKASLTPEQKEDAEKAKFSQAFTDIAGLRIGVKMAYWSNYFSAQPENKAYLRFVQSKTPGGVAVPHQFDSTSFVQVVTALAQSEKLEEVYDRWASQQEVGRKIASIPPTSPLGQYIKMDDVPKMLEQMRNGSIVHLVHKNKVQSSAQASMDQQGILVRSGSQVMIRYGTRGGQIRESEVYRYLKLLTRDPSHAKQPLIGIYVHQISAPASDASLASDSM